MKDDGIMNSYWQDIFDTYKSVYSGKEEVPQDRQALADSTDNKASNSYIVVQMAIPIEGNNPSVDMASLRQLFEYIIKQNFPTSEEDPSE